MNMAGIAHGFHFISIRGKRKNLEGIKDNMPLFVGIRGAKISRFCVFQQIVMGFIRRKEMYNYFSPTEKLETDRYSGNQIKFTFVTEFECYYTRTKYLLILTTIKYYLMLKIKQMYLFHQPNTSCLSIFDPGSIIERRVFSQIFD